MLHQNRVVPLCSAALCAACVPALAQARPVMRVSLVQVNGQFESRAASPGHMSHPPAIILAQQGMAPIHVNSEANTDASGCSAHGTSQEGINFAQQSDGAIQITGTFIVGTLDAIVAGQPEPEGGPFASATTRASTTLVVSFSLTRWSYLSYAGTMSIGSVAAVGFPTESRAQLRQSWSLMDGSGQELASRQISLSSEDTPPRVQDVSYATVVVRPGNYQLQLGIDGDASGGLTIPGATGWTCAGSYGIAVSALAATCLADWDQNGVLDSADFFEFMNAYFLEAADFNQDNVVDSRDLFDFLEAFMEGC